MVWLGFTVKLLILLRISLVEGTSNVEAYEKLPHTLSADQLGRSISNSELKLFAVVQQGPEVQEAPVD